MKGSRAELARAARVRAAVDLATAGRRLVSPGARIEEILAFPLERYPNEIMPMDLLPTMDNFAFIGYTADFEEIEVTQTRLGNALMNTATAPLAGWKPKRMGILSSTIKLND